MQKINLNRRNITIIVSYVFLTALFFSLGYFFGFKNINEPIVSDVSTNVTSLPYQTPTPTQPQSILSYRVILEDGEIRLYIDENGKSRLISSEKISEESYPVSDIASLKSGIEFETADEAVSLIENLLKFLIFI